ncbi:alpha/beta fold hydrolase [Paracoccus sp. CPCC 101403]|uniref:Alpha/beta fold hydrolase n=1 Tax=Paracoccus broussonetiae TaxID=3075834 RepID=A0ABU3EJ03_9RHOB|nr:alpha/beta fold hydrolase [Paracoccus sp. CPCC 101403]MDT1064230.1 alpha/beta fold hydrolase [Paracoccus sp. CPCC 101403]
MEEKIHFYSDCLKIAGTFRAPDSRKKGERLPCIIGIHGGSGTSTANALKIIGGELSEAGYCFLTFHHRGFGESEGIRGRSIWQNRFRDIEDAITYAQQRPEVDPERIGLIGLSIGGAYAVYTAGVDERVKCAVEVGGMGDGERRFRLRMPYYEFLELQDQIKEDRIRRVMTGESKRRAYRGNEYLGPEHEELRKKSKDKETYNKEGYPLENTDNLMSFRPESVVHQISPRAILFVNAERDAIVPVDEARSMYAKAGEPKKLMVIPGSGHGEVYPANNPEVFASIMQESLDWYARHL